MTQPKPMRWYVYRMFDASDVLLYVGQSMVALKRMSEHQNKAAWFDQVAVVRITKVESKTEALRAEREAIRTEKPLHNLALRQRKCPKCMREWL